MTNRRWKRLEQVLPPQKPTTGRPAADHRRVLAAILWVLRTGAPGRALPERSGPWQTTATRFSRWVQDDTWERILAALQRQADAEGDVTGICTTSTARPHPCPPDRGGRAARPGRSGSTGNRCAPRAAVT